MSELVIAIDFGSTFTKVTALDLSAAAILGRAQAPTTVETNILDGLKAALARLSGTHPKLNTDAIAASRKVASSSAAGGLGIIAIGLVPELTLEAARKAALGAGAKVIGSHAFELDRAAIAEIERSPCDIVLLAGGIDGGNTRGILHNARMVAQSDMKAPIILAGNRSATEEAASILTEAGKIVIPCANVLPKLDRLNVDEARSKIRDLFNTRIVMAKGFEDAQNFVGSPLVPTPRATLQAAALIANGNARNAGTGPLVVVEIGGATINIHSIGEGRDPDFNATFRGVPEPYEKRTVEGDLGIRINAHTILETHGVAALRAYCPPGINHDTIKAAVQHRHQNVAFVPDCETELNFDIALASVAVHAALGRHAGTIEQAWTGGAKPINVQTGKDLTCIQTIVGTGGLCAFNPYAEKVIRNALATPHPFLSLSPRQPKIALDRNYIMYAIGLLASIDEGAALELAKAHLLDGV